MTETYRIPGGSTTRAALRGSEVVEQIKTYIVQNHLTPGDPMPTEGVLCEELGASRSSVREAIKTLSALDIVEVRHGHGTFVGRLSLAALVEGLTFRALLSSRDDFTVLAELVDVRQLLEQGLAGPVIAAFDDDMHHALSTLVVEMEEHAQRGETFLEQDRQFHLLLMESFGNGIVAQLTAAFWDVHAIVTPLLDFSVSDAIATAAAHRAILDAAASGDVAAYTQAIADHYKPVRKQLEIKLAAAANRS